MSALSQRLKSTRLWRVFFGAKKYECQLYFLGPRTLWLGKPHVDDIIHARRFRVRDFAVGYGRAYAARFQHIDWIVRDVEADRFVCGHLPPARAESA